MPVGRTWLKNLPYSPFPFSFLPLNLTSVNDTAPLKVQDLVLQTLFSQGPNLKQCQLNLSLANNTLCMGLCYITDVSS